MSSFGPSKINWFLFFKLPSAFFAGVRVHNLQESSCTTTVKYGWKNQNPFRSIFWAVQGMAAELSTGVLLMAAIRKTAVSISMLVLEVQGSFVKKAKGHVFFTCSDGSEIEKLVERAIESGETQGIWLKSVGRDDEGEIVALFEFQWSLKVRKS